MVHVIYLVLSIGSDFEIEQQIQIYLEMRLFKQGQSVLKTVIRSCETTKSENLPVKIHIKA